MELNDVRTIVANLDDFLELPDGIERLRNAVLTLAVSGRLMPQDPKDGTTESVYSKFRIRKVQQPHQRKIRTLESLSAENAPYIIPKSWSWARLTHLVDQGVLELTRGNVISKKDIEAFPGHYPIYSSARLNDGVFGHYGKYMFDEELITWSIDGGGHPFYRPKHQFSVTNVSGILRIIEPSVLNYQYLHLVLRVEHSKQSFDYSKKAHPSDIRYIYNIPIPPLAEQKRIVEKLTAVMKQLDDLEAKKKERDVVRARLTRSAMRTLGEGNGKLPLQHLPELVKSPLDIKELENAILTLAVSGRLVLQDDKEGTAEELLVEIQNGRSDQSALRNGRKRKIKELSYIKTEEMPFKIPESWKLIRMRDIAAKVTDGEHLSPTKQKNGVPLLTAKNIQEAGITFYGTDFVSESDAKKFWQRCRPEKGDLLVCSRGTIGRVTVIDVSDPFCLMGSVILVKFSSPILSEFCRIYLRTKSGKEQIGALRKGMAVGALYLKDLETAIIPLPPLAEQRRIVKKVQEIREHIQCLQKIFP